MMMMVRYPFKTKKNLERKKPDTNHDSPLGKTLSSNKPSYFASTAHSRGD